MMFRHFAGKAKKHNTLCTITLFQEILDIDCRESDSTSLWCLISQLYCCIFLVRLCKAGQYTLVIWQYQTKTLHNNLANGAVKQSLKLEQD